MNKSLAPLIISFGVIILLTFIVIYSKPGKIEMPEDEDQYESIKLSPFPSKKVKKERPSENKINYAPDSVKVLEQVRKLLSDGKESEAEEQLRTLLIFEPSHPEALSLLGGVLFYSQRYGESEVIFRRQVANSPDNSAFYNQLGSVLAKENKFEEALKMSLKAVELNPDSPEARINLAGMYSVTGDKNNAIKHFFSAYRLMGHRILPFSHDPSLDKIRDMPEFQEIISMAKQEWENRLKDGASEKTPDKDKGSIPSPK